MTLEQNFKLTTGYRATLCARTYVKAPLSTKNMEVDITIKEKLQEYCFSLTTFSKKQGKAAVIVSQTLILKNLFYCYFSDCFSTFKHNFKHSTRPDSRCFGVLPKNHNPESIHLPRSTTLVCHILILFLESPDFVPRGELLAAPLDATMRQKRNGNK